MDNRDKRNTTILYVSISVCLFLYLSTYLLNGTEEAKVEAKNQSEASEEDQMKKVPDEELETKKKIIKQPTTHISHMYTTILKEIIEDLVVEKTKCTPEDFGNEEKHKMPKSASKTMKAHEPPVMVIYIAVALLLTSLGAAFLDFYRARAELNSPDNGKKKPTLTRRCSLADLTVLRHTRKESMKKDSIFEGNTTGKVIGRKVSRPPLRLD